MRFYITRRKLRLCPPNFASSHQCFLKLRNGILHFLFSTHPHPVSANDQIIQRYSKEFRKQNHVIIRCRYYSALNFGNAFLHQYQSPQPGPPAYTLLICVIPEFLLHIHADRNTYVSPSAQPVQNRIDGRSKRSATDGEEKNPVPIKQNMGIP